MFCSQCGEKLPENSKFCYKCGANLGGTSQNSVGNENSSGIHTHTNVPQPGNGKKMGLIAAAVVAVLVIGASTFFVLRDTNAPDSPVYAAQVDIQSEQSPLTAAEPVVEQDTTPEPQEADEPGTPVIDTSDWIDAGLIRIPPDWSHDPQRWDVQEEFGDLLHIYGDVVNDSVFMTIQEFRDNDAMAFPIAALSQQPFQFDDGSVGTFFEFVERLVWLNGNVYLNFGDIPLFADNEDLITAIARTLTTSAASAQQETGPAVTALAWPASEIVGTWTVTNPNAAYGNVWTADGLLQAGDMVSFLPDSTGYHEFGANLGLFIWHVDLVETAYGPDVFVAPHLSMHFENNFIEARLLDGNSVLIGDELHLFGGMAHPLVLVPFMP